MRRIVSAIAVVAVIGVVAARAWRRNPRIGTAFVNSVVNPALLRRGLAGGAASELGTIEHVGRKTGIRRLTPVHPEPTRDGYRVLVPLGESSEWARNVIAAGHCRLHLHESVIDLDEPLLVRAAEVDGLAWPVRRLMAALGFEYLTLHTFATHAGRLETTATEPAVVEEREALPVA